MERTTMENQWKAEKAAMEDQWKAEKGAMQDAWKLERVALESRATTKEAKKIEALCVLQGVWAKQKEAEHDL